MPVPRRLAPPLAALAVLAGAAGVAVAAAPLPPEAPTPPGPPPEPPAAAPSHRALATGWGRARAGGEPLHAEPRIDAPAVAAAPVGLAGRAQRAEWDADGTTWVRMAYPGGVRGWAPGAAIAPAPPAPSLAPATRRALVRATATLGRGSALVVRDPLGRTVFAAGTRAPLSIASLTKLATVGAALGGSLTVRESAAILGPSDNGRAQALSNRVGGGSRALGARRAVEWAAGLGADVRLVDGSGLSPANRASAGEIADLLLAVRADPRFRVLLRGMPVAGRSGTLRWRMRGTAAVGRVRAKTGSLFDHPTSSLAGYLWPAGSGLRPDRALVVAMLENGISPYRARPVQDAVAAALAAPGALQPAGAAVSRAGGR